MANDSILESTKEALGMMQDYTVFDSQIVMHINSVFSTLNQLAVGPASTFSIEDGTPVWADFIQGKDAINAVRSYMVLRVRLLFDPPATSFALDSFAKQIQELEWRLNSIADPGLNGETSGGIVTPPIVDTSSYIWNLSNGAEFPPEAPPGAIGIDLITGDIYQKDS